MRHVDPGDQDTRPPTDSTDPAQESLFGNGVVIESDADGDLVAHGVDYEDLEFRPRARNTDPPTSHQAAESMVEPAKAQRAMAYACLKQSGPMNADEIDERLAWQHGIDAWPRTTAGRRLNEMAEPKMNPPLVRRLEETRKTRSGRNACLWEVV